MMEVDLKDLDLNDARLRFAYASCESRVSSSPTFCRRVCKLLKLWKLQ